MTRPGSGTRNVPEPFFIMQNSLTVEENPASAAMYAVGALVAAAAAYGAYRMLNRPAAPAPQAETVEQRAARIVAVGAGTHPDELTTQLYKEVFPECPDVIDPNNLEHALCAENWLDAQVFIEAAEGARVAAAVSRWAATDVADDEAAHEAYRELRPDCPVTAQGGTPCGDWYFRLWEMVTEARTA